MKKVMKQLFLLTLLSVFVLTGTSAFAKSQPQEEGQLTIVAHVTVKPEYKAEIMKAFEAVVEGTRKEPGNISYILHQHVGNPLKFTFVEVWKSQQAIDAHNSSAHFQKFAKAVDGKADLEVYTMKKEL